MMSGEEMEIATDFGHSGFGEEIDIDLDFAVGHHDEDLELADFDQTQDIQDFNVDTRDEMMAEVDDASYGMIDADDIEHNVVATTANDIEIDLGDTEQNLWEQNTSHVETFENTDEIDYIDVNDLGENDVGNTSAENVDYTEDGAADKQPAIEPITDERPLAQSSGAVAQGSPHDSPKDSPADPQPLASVDETLELENGEGNNAIAHEERVSTIVASDHGSVEDHSEEHSVEQQIEQQVEQPVEQEQKPGYDHTPEPTNDQEGGGVSPSIHGPVKTDDYTLSAVARHNIYVTYHRMNYRLFAESEEDDPNSYFLSDLSALQLKLGDFLSSLRDVIAEEVSPLDELVMMVDGLGIEFSESSPRELLDGFTFGEILTLYDRLVQNDGEELSTDICIYLLVGPNCLKRLMALYDSAGAGRGLSEVGVYRDPTPAGEDQVGEDQADYDQADEGQDGKDQATEDQTDEDQARASEVDGSEVGESQSKAPSQSPHEPDHYNSEGDEEDDVKETENDTPAVKEADTKDLAERFEKAEEKTEEKTGSITNESVNKDADDLIDYSDDDDLDVSASQQDLDEQQPISTSRALEVSSSQPTPNRRNLEWPVASLGQQFSPLQRELPSPQFGPSNLHMITNSYIPEDKAKASPRDSTHEAQKESDDTIPVGDGVSSQHASPLNGPNDVASDGTSATATLAGDDNDEIDYSDDDDADTNGLNNDPSNNGPSNNGSSYDGPVETPRLQVPIDDEITWESENEDAQDDPPTTSKDAVQVSPSGKRPRPDSDLSDSESGPIDVKRRRSS